MNYIRVGLFLIFSLVPSLATSPPLVLTTYISQNRTQEARNLSSVDPTYFLNISSHSGFLNVDEKYNSNLFFWYFPVAGKPVNETPWLVWLQGGPGGSSLDGLFLENGPFEFVDDTLKLREYPWTKDYSVLYIDNPVGAGFSSTDDDRGYVTNMETCANHLFSVLDQFMKIFPELVKASFYIAGESYAGRYVPALGLKILAEKERGNDIVNLQGIIMGNPVINREDISDYSKTYYQWGMIDDQGLLAVKPQQEAYDKAVKDGDNENAVKGRDDLLDKLQEMAMQAQNYNVLKDEVLTPKLKEFVDFIQQPDIREALHVGLSHFVFSGGRAAHFLIADFLSNVNPQVEKLLEHYRILIYCGQLDAVASCVQNSKARRRKWHWSGRDEFLNSPRIPWWYNETVAGYVKSGGGFTEVLVRGAGHLVPLDKPAPTSQLISYFIQNLHLPIPTNYQFSPQDTAPYEELEDEKWTSSSYYTSNAGFISSVMINVILVLFIVAGALYVIRWKRRRELSFYGDEDSTISENLLTLA